MQGFQLPTIEEFEIPTPSDEKSFEADEMRVLEDLFQSKLILIKSEKLKKFLANPADYKQFWTDCCKARRKLERANQLAEANIKFPKKKDCYIFTEPFFIPEKPTLRSNYIICFISWSGLIFFFNF